MKMQRIFATVLVTMMASLFMGMSQDDYMRPVSVPDFRTALVFFLGPANVTQSNLRKLKNKVNSAKGASSAKGYARLGEAQLKYAAAVYINENEKFYKKLSAYMKSSSNKAPPKVNHLVSSSYVKSAAKSLSRAYKKLKRNPKVLYHYGVALGQTKQPLAVNVLDELTTLKRKHPYRAAGYVALGDYYYFNGDIPKSVREYKRALELKDSGSQLYLKYKQSWQDFVKAKQSNNNKRAKSAIVRMISVVKKSKSTRGSVAQRINDQATGDVIGLLADLGDTALAKSALGKIGLSELYEKTLERIAMQKMDNNDTKGAYRIYSSLLANSKLSPKAPEISIKLLNLASSWNNTKLIDKNLQYIISNYVDDESKWADENDDELVEKTAKIIEPIIYQYATDYDRIGRDQRNNTFLKNAIKLYDSYIENFDDSKRVAEIKYYRAQLDLMGKKYEKATKQLLAILDEHPRFKSNKEVADLTIESVQLTMDNDPTKYKLPAPGRARSEIPIGRIPKLYADTLDSINKRYPKNPDAGSMYFAAANVYFDFGHYDEAMKRYRNFIRKNPRNSFSKEAAIKLLGYHLLKKNKTSYEEAKKLVAANPTLRQDKQLAPLLKTTVSLRPSKSADDEADDEDDDEDEGDDSDA